MIKKLHIDVETYSETDLMKAGAYRYAEDPAFRVLLFGYSYEDPNPDGYYYEGATEELVDVIDLENGEPIPAEIVSHIADPDVLKYAHNANFERICLSRHFNAPMPPEQWRCTAAWARSLSLPGALGKLTEALGFPTDKAKDKNGKRLIKKFCMPGRKQMDIGGTDWLDFKEYCRQDVIAEMAVLDYLGSYPLPDAEWKLWALDQRINDRGMPIDMELVSRIRTIESNLREILSKRIREITGIANPNSRDQLLTWLSGVGVEVNDLTAGTVAELLKGTFNPEAFLKVIAEVKDLERRNF